MINTQTCLNRLELTRENYGCTKDCKCLDCLNKEKEEEYVPQEENHEKCFFCGDYVDECTCSGGMM